MGRGQGQESTSLSLKNVASPICPSALVHIRWSGRAGDGRVPSLFFLPIFVFPVCFVRPAEYTTLGFAPLLAIWDVL